MASFFKDICKLSRQGDKYFEGRYEKDILEGLCDRSASFKVWEYDVREFMYTEGIYVRFRD